MYQQNLSGIREFKTVQLKKPSLQKPVVLHVIDSLGMGGAEMLLNHTLDLLSEIEHILVYLFEGNEVQSDFYNKSIEVIGLNCKGWKTMPLSIFRLRAIIRQKKPFLVHSHLFYSTIYTRLALPRSVPLVSTIHSLYSQDAFKKNIKSLWAARLTLKKRHSIIGVSQHVLTDYLSYVPFQGKRFVLYNFLSDAFFQPKSPTSLAGKIKLVAIGNLKAAKNYPYLLQILKGLSDVSLDIYGTGSEEPALREYIQKEALEVRLCGNATLSPGLLQQYHYFIQASLHEGFGLTVIEAMAAGLPVLLSDIPVFREISGGFAHFFTLDDAGKAAGGIAAEIAAPDLSRRRTTDGFQFVKDQYAASRYKKQLLRIYGSVAPKLK